MILHLLHYAPSDLDKLLAENLYRGNEDKLLFLQDSSYLLRATNQGADKIAALPQSCYVLDDDVAARGLADKLADHVTVIDYAGFVALTIECNSSQSWMSI